MTIHSSRTILNIPKIMYTESLSWRIVKLLLFYLKCYDLIEHMKVESDFKTIIVYLLHCTTVHGWIKNAYVFYKIKFFA